MFRITIFLHILIFLCLTSCVPFFLGGSGVLISGIILSKNQPPKDIVEDSMISLRIKRKLLFSDIKNAYVGTQIQVVEGRILCTGWVYSYVDMIKILKIIWSVEGVRTVFNELQVQDLGYSFSFSDYILDSFITTSIKSNTLFSSLENFTNYNILSYRQNVYLFGIAENELELLKVINIAANTKNVRNVISYVRIVNQDDLHHDFNDIFYIKGVNELHQEKQINSKKIK